MTEKRSPISVYGADWCLYCIRTRIYPDPLNVNYRWINISEDPEARTFVEKTNKGFQSVPTIIWADGLIFVDPSMKQLILKMRSNI